MRRCAARRVQAGEQRLHLIQTRGVHQRSGLQQRKRSVAEVGIGIVRGQRSGDQPGRALGLQRCRGAGTELKLLPADTPAQIDGACSGCAGRAIAGRWPPRATRLVRRAPGRPRPTSATPGRGRSGGPRSRGRPRCAPRPRRTSGGARRERPPAGRRAAGPQPRVGRRGSDVRRVAAVARTPPPVARAARGSGP